MPWPISGASLMKPIDLVQNSSRSPARVRSPPGWNSLISRNMLATLPRSSGAIDHTPAAKTTAAAARPSVPFQDR